MRRRYTLIYAVAVVLLVYSLASLSASYSKYLELQSRSLRLCETAQQLQGENARLHAQLEAVESGEAMEALARERLGFVMPNERVFYFIEDGDKENG